MSLRRTVASGLIAVGAVGGMAACSLVEPSTPMLLENLTDTPVAIHANGAWVGTYEPGAIREVAIPGEPPVGIEVVSPSGAVLDEWSFDAKQAVDGGVLTSELPCGVIRLSVGAVELPALGDLAPSLGPCP